MKYLITTIAAVVLVGCGDPDGALIQAARDGDIEVVKQHLAAGTDVNTKDDDEYTPLHWAAMEGRREVAELLISQGANVNAKNKVGSTPLHIAAYMKFDLAELLIAKGATINVTDDVSRTPLDDAIEGDKKETVDLLRKHGGKTGEELSIHKAAAKGNIEAVKQHLAAGADVNAKDDGVTPLDWAIRLKKTATADLLRKHGAKTREELNRAQFNNPK